MTSTQRPAGAWSSFVQTLAEHANVPAERIARETPLVEQLQLDSLALTELVVSLLDAYPSSRFAHHLDGRNWATTTADELFQDCINDSRR